MVDSTTPHAWVTRVALRISASSGLLLAPPKAAPSSLICLATHAPTHTRPWNQPSTHLDHRAGALGGESPPLWPWSCMSPLARRLSRLPIADVLGHEAPVATGLRSRLLGLSHLDREQAGPGLLIPRCSSVHTFGMRFALDLVFLDRRGVPVAVRRGVPPRRVASHRAAAAVLELPARIPSSKETYRCRKGSQCQR